MRLPRISLATFLALAVTPALAQEGFEKLKDQCIACHGEAGFSEIPESPSLGGIDDYYALLQLVAFRSGNRKADVMNEVTAEMSNDDLRAAAAWIDSLPRPPAPDTAGDPENMKRGAELVAQNHCTGCHGKDLLGGHQMPPLRHQREDYLLNALRDYKAERRFGDRAAMVEVVQKISDEDLEVLAHYMAHLPAQ